MLALTAVNIASSLTCHTMKSAYQTSGCCKDKAVTPYIYPVIDQAFVNVPRVHLPNGVDESVFQMSLPMVADWTMEDGKHVHAFLEELPLDHDAKREVWSHNGTKWNVQSLSVKDLQMPCLQGYFLDDTTSAIAACLTKHGIEAFMDYYPTPYTCNDCFANGFTYKNLLTNVTADGPCDCQSKCNLHTECLTFGYKGSTKQCNLYASTDFDNMIADVFGNGGQIPSEDPTITHSGPAVCPGFDTPVLCPIEVKFGQSTATKYGSCAIQKPDLPTLDYVTDTDYVFTKWKKNDPIYAHQMIDWYNLGQHVVYHRAGVANIKSSYRRTFTNRDVYDFPYDPERGIYDNDDFNPFIKLWIRKYWVETPPIDATGAIGFQFWSGISWGVAVGYGTVCGDTHRLTPVGDDHLDMQEDWGGDYAWDNRTMMSFQLTTPFRTGYEWKHGKVSQIETFFSTIIHETGHPLDGWHGRAWSGYERSWFNNTANPLTDTQCDRGAHGLFGGISGYRFNQWRYDGCQHNKNHKDCSTLMSYDNGCDMVDNETKAAVPLADIITKPDYLKGIGNEMAIDLMPDFPYRKPHFSQHNKRVMSECARNKKLGKSFYPTVPMTPFVKEQSVTTGASISFDDASYKDFLDLRVLPWREAPKGESPNYWRVSNSRAYSSAFADTGPGTDNTIGTKLGKFLYTEVSGSFKQMKYSFKLYPQCASGTVKSLEFHYHSVSRTCTGTTGYFDGRCQSFVTSSDTLKGTEANPMRVHKITNGTASKIWTGTLFDDSVTTNPIPEPNYIVGCHDNPYFKDKGGYGCLNRIVNCTSQYAAWGYTDDQIAPVRENCPEVCSEVTPKNVNSPTTACTPPVKDSRWVHAKIEGDDIHHADYFEFVVNPGRGFTWAGDHAIDDISWTCA